MKFPSILPKIPPHKEPRDWRAAVALVASIFGSVAMTAFSATLVYIMWKGGWPDSTAEARVEVLSKALMLSLAGSLVVLISLGLAINRRSVKLGKDGLDVSGGDEPSSTLPPIVTTTTTTAVTPVAPVTIDSPTPAPEPDLLPDPEPLLTTPTPEPKRGRRGA